MVQIIGKESSKNKAKVEPKEEKRVKKLMYIEDPEKIQVTRREREEQQRLQELKYQKRVKKFTYIQDPENMQHIHLKRNRGQQMRPPKIGKTKVPGLLRSTADQSDNEGCEVNGPIDSNQS